MRYGILIWLLFPLSLQAQQPVINIPKKTEADRSFRFDIPKDVYCKNLGFFCRQEVALDKKLAMPIRFRVGSMDQCNYLEQKTAYKLPQQ